MKKVLVVGAIHGNREVLNSAFNTFLAGHYDKIIFTGDICDSFDRSNEEIIACVNILNGMLSAYKDRVVALIGNHDQQYFSLYPENGVICSGFRPELHMSLYSILNPMKRFYQYAYGIGNHLFTHAGVQYGWLSKHFDVLDKWGSCMQLDVTDPTNLWMIIDAVSRTRDSHIVYEVGPGRGGADSNFGGPLWCDMDEMLNKGPYPGLNQVCGHTKSDYIYRFHNFEGKKHYKNTSVTYIDVLGSRTQFLTLNIKE